VAKTNFETLELTNYLLTDNTKFQKNDFNIYEPVDGIEVPNSKIDVVFVPLLAYDKKGNRVGYGKGFYDKFLSKCKEDVVKIGLSFFEPEEAIEDINETDIHLDYCVTPMAVYNFQL
jgi:5-formyltetrahydrofolate cyclo-ligase